MAVPTKRGLAVALPQGLGRLSTSPADRARSAHTISAASPSVRRGSSVVGTPARAFALEGASVAVASPLERYEREYLPLVHLIEDFESAS